MTEHEILENLCYYDKRNPYYNELTDNSEHEYEKRNPCFCDNCFYGRTKLANEILKLRKKDN